MAEGGFESQFLKISVQLPNHYTILAPFMPIVAFLPKQTETWEQFSCEKMVQVEKNKPPEMFHHPDCSPPHGCYFFEDGKGMLFSLPNMYCPTQSSLIPGKLLRQAQMLWK